MPNNLKRRWLHVGPRVPTLSQQISSDGETVAVPRAQTLQPLRSDSTGRSSPPALIILAFAVEPTPNGAWMRSFRCDAHRRSRSSELCRCVEGGRCRIGSRAFQRVLGPRSPVAVNHGIRCSQPAAMTRRALKVTSFRWPARSPCFSSVPPIVSVFPRLKCHGIADGDPPTPAMPVPPRGLSFAPCLSGGARWAQDRWGEWSDAIP